MQLIFTLLQASAQQAPSGAGTMIFMVGILAVFYFFMIRPQQKRAKEDRIFRENIQKGDKVMSIGGIHGKIISIDEKDVLMQIDEGVKIRIEKTALKPIGSPQNV